MQSASGVPSFRLVLVNGKEEKVRVALLKRERLTRKRSLAYYDCYAPPLCCKNDTVWKCVAGMMFIVFLSSREGVRGYSFFRLLSALVPALARRKPSACPGCSQGTGALVGRARRGAYSSSWPAAPSVTSNVTCALGRMRPDRQIPISL